MTRIDCSAEVWQALSQDGAQVTVPGSWEGMPGAAFGGFAAASMFAGAAARAKHARPLSLHARFHRPAPIETPLSLTVEAEREGRAVATYRTRLQDPAGRLLLSGSVAFGAPTPVRLRGQGATPMRALLDPISVAEVVAGLGLPVPPMMRHVGFRRPQRLADDQEHHDWHVYADWPAPRSLAPNDQAIAAIMCIDAFVGPATMVANGVPTDRRWPMVTPSLDVTAWFHDGLEPPGSAAAARERLNVRTSVPATGGGYALGRSQVWLGDHLTAEGLSQITLLPAPA